MVAALYPQPAKPHRKWHHVTTSRRHTIIVLAIWRCWTDNGFWPEINYLTGQTGIPLVMLSNDLLHLVQEGDVMAHGWAFKLKVRRFV